MPLVFLKSRILFASVKMKRIERFKFLQVFGDGKPHNWFEVVFLGVQFLKVHQSYFEKVFKTALAYDLIRRVPTAAVYQMLDKMEKSKSGIVLGPSWMDYEYQISPRGDACLREEQILRGGEHSYYDQFDRSLTGSKGLDHFAPLPKGLKPLK